MRSKVRARVGLGLGVKVRVRVRVRVRVGPGEPAFAVADGAALVLQGVHDAVLDA